jgi:predicted ATPase/DNA-binding XRE family transcriptional regulator
VDLLATTPFGSVLRHYRLAAALSQERLAARAGVSTDAIRALERGRRTTPHPETIALLADALELSADDRAAFSAAATDTQPPTPSVDAPMPFAPPAALPAALTLLIGREREEAAVVRLLRRDRGRLVTLIGPGGVGKTRLAIQVAATLAPDYPDGVVFVDLSPATDAALVPSFVARALGVREVGDRPILDAVVARLAGRQLLLVLDNFEQVEDAAPVVATLLERCPRVAVLVTSRTPLRLRAEQRFLVPSLAIPASTQRLAVEEIAAYAAVRLFVERARSIQPSFTLTAENAAAIATICAQLDGLPLAVELAAAKITMLPPAALLARLSQIAMRMAGPRDLPDRQRTLHAAITWSLDLLSAAEQAIFAHVGVFMGGFTLEAATAICATDEHSPLDVEVAIASLLDKSLLRTMEGDRDEPRFRMLQTIRAHALERLTAMGAMGALRRAHGAFFAGLAADAEAHFRGADESAWMERLARERDNLRAALVWYREADPAAGLGMAAHLWYFWWVRGELDDGRRWLEHLLERMPDPTVTRTKGLLGAGVLAMQQSDWRAASAHFAAGLALSRALGERALTAWFLRELGAMHSHRSDYAAARALLEEAVELGRALGDPRDLEASLLNLARIVRMQGEYASAEELLAEALMHAEARQSLSSIAAIRAVRGDVARYRADLSTAAAEYDAGLSAARAVGHTNYIAWTLAGLGQVALWQGDTTRAVTLLEEGLALHRTLDNLHSIAFVLHILGLAALRAGNREQASGLLREALAIREQYGSRGGMIDSMEGLAMVRAASGHLERGVHLLAAAAAARTEIGAVAPPVEQAGVIEAIRAAETALGARAFATAWDTGAKLSLDQALIIARDDATR